MKSKILLGLFSLPLLIANSVESYAGELTLGWDRFYPKPIEYNVYVKTEKEAKFDYDKPAATVEGTQAVITGIEFGNTYFFVLRARKQDGTETDDSKILQYSPWMSEPLEPAAPHEPKNLRINASIETIVNEPLFSQHPSEKFYKNFL